MSATGFTPSALIADLLTAGEDEVLMRKVIEAHRKTGV